MKEKFKSKIAMQIFSVGVAIILWFIISYSENPVIDITVKNVPISYTNISELEERGMTIVRDDKLPSVSVVVRGNRNELFSVIKNISASIDLSKINSAGSYDMPIDVNIPIKSVELLKKRTNNINISVEPIVTRTVPVRIMQNGVNNDYLVKSSSDITEIDIVGARTDVNSVSAATVTLDISDVKSNSSSSYSYSFTDNQGNEIEAYNISSQTTSLVISNKVYIAKNVPIKITYPPELLEDYAVTVENETSLTADIGVAKEYYDDITELNAVFPSTAVSADMGEVTLAVEADDKIYMPDGEYVRVKANAVKKEIKNIILPVTPQNISDGLSVMETNLTVGIIAKGVASELDASLMTAAADLSGMTEGSHRVKLKITAPPNVKIEQDYYVEITLE